METRTGSPAIQLVLLLLWASPAGARSYEVVDLGAVGSPSSAYGVNWRGAAAGYASHKPDTVRAALYQGGLVRDIGSLGGQQSLARALNGPGEVVGGAAVVGGQRHAFIWKDGELSDLGTLGGRMSDAHDINDAGQICGISELADLSTLRPVLWDHGEPIDLGTLGGSIGRAQGINELGQVVGFSATSGDREQHAFHWKDGVMTDLGTLGGSSSKAYEINDAGMIVGWSLTTGEGRVRAALWTAGEIRDLGELPGGHSVAYSINELGEIVGFSYDASGRQVATRFEGEKVVDLNGLIAPASGWVLNAAHDINDAGQIVGSGTLFGQSHAFLLTPITPAVVEDAPRPARMAFRGARPNPATAGAAFAFELPAAGRVRLGLYDARGRRVRAMVDRDFGAGPAEVRWDGRDDDGASLAPGVYWARFEAAGHVIARRVLVLH